jgi:hypothetical protein
LGEYFGKKIVLETLEKKPSKAGAKQGSESELRHIDGDSHDKHE